MTARIPTLLFLLSLCVPSGAVAQVSSSADRAVSGSVIDPRTHAGMIGVRVRLSPGDREARTDATGRFLLTQVPPGRYRLHVDLDGYQPVEYPHDVVVAEAGDPPPLVVDYSLTIAAEVRGRTEATTAVPITGALATAVSGRAIASAPGGLEDVFRVFQSQPGVAASKDDRNDLLVRGGGAIENAVRIDGFDVPNPSHFGAQGGSGGGLSMVAPWLIERAVLHAGGFPVEFGDRASSVLDLSLKGAEGTRVHGMGGVSVGGAMAEADGPLGSSRGAWLVSARRSFLELVFDRGPDRAVPHYTDVLGRFDYALTPKHRLGFLAIAGKDDVYTEGTTDRLDDRQSTVVVGVSLRSRWSPTTSSGLYVSYGRAAIDAEMTDRAVNEGYDRGHETEWRARAEVRRTFGAAEAMAGASVRQTGVQYDLYSKAFRNEYGSLVPILQSSFAGTFTDVGAYADIRIPLGGRLFATPGLRVDRTDRSRQVSASPRLSLEYRVTPDVRVSGAAGVYRQAIPFIWIASIPANASLRPVRSVQVQAGVAVRLPRGLQAAVEAFDKRYDAYPVDPAEPWHVLVTAAADFESPFVGKLDPGGRLRAHGFDAKVSRRFVDRVEIGAAYSLWYVTQSGLDGVWRAADYDIRHQTRLDVTWEIPGAWRAGAEFRFASGRPYTPYDPKASSKAGWGRYDRTQIYAATYPAYHRLDARIERTFTISGTRLVVYGEIDNLYNRDNVYLYQWSNTLKASKPVYQWGVMPLGGIRWEF
jgi:hypothetical protein